ncbi:hypothetical protein S40285_04975 [Stachybotrys chlorohalonatus IBT 40285]|uniref:Uncharacterized protein n=1 Tax=Stachybotrys chlorohalonatus (strain IBT 40285) TaxID=1283841 RepID=A0A084QRV7_STAC4|nr:hypothetical protein S40285_04975 [Stachybotrys chlorohalonata IBT 40285]
MPAATAYASVPTSVDQDAHDKTDTSPVSTSSSTNPTPTPLASHGDRAPSTPLSPQDSTASLTADPGGNGDVVASQSHQLSTMAPAAATQPEATTSTPSDPARAASSTVASNQDINTQTHTNGRDATRAASHETSSAFVRPGSTGEATLPPALRGRQYESQLTEAPRPPRSIAATIDTAPDDSHLENLPSPLSPLPLRTASVQPDTVVAYPTPILHSTSDISTLAIKHPIPDLNTKSGSYIGNIAQLEATAERLSMTSSIDDAIRDLHGELKRSDSRRSRSSVLAVNDDTNNGASCQLSRHRSQSSSIVATNTAARYGGYSPAGYVMSPNHSLTGRLRAGSKNSSGRPESDFEPMLSRHGPGKASVRSVRSAKMSLAEIAESEPISLTQHVLDEADAAPPIDFEHDAAMLSLNADVLSEDGKDGVRSLPEEDDDPTPPALQSTQDLVQQVSYSEVERPGSSYSDNTSMQGRDAFVDFDGVHCEPDDFFEPPLEPEPEPEIPQQIVPPRNMVRPQSYFDETSGQQMLYYPARVPAMLNLPQKLSNKPKATERNVRRSQVLSAMMDMNRQHAMPERNRHSAMPNFDFGSSQPPADATRDSWLPDPVAGHRDSFAALSTFDPVQHSETRSLRDEPLAPPETDVEHAAGTLRRPPRLSRPDSAHRNSRMSRLDNLPPHLRASAFFELPSTSPEIEVKNGSAMDTLDSILDASAVAPVNAFTDHQYAGKLGPEVYGKEKKRKSQTLSVMLDSTTTPKEPKKRSSFLWSKRTTSYNSEDKPNSSSGVRNSEVPDLESQALRSNADGQSVRRDEDGEWSSDDAQEKDDQEEDEDLGGDGFQGPPTTLLAELQLRKQQQKQRTQHISKAFPNGIHSTLLEMDAVAETQRKQRIGKRVNLAWEDPDAHVAENDSDDEDIPLAIIAAKNQGAKNMADLERPIGLMERREMEDNEPLSRRRARLQGHDVSMLPKRTSMMTLSAPMMVGPVSPAQLSPAEPEQEEVEGETLGERKKRLAALESAQDEAEGRLPRTRPISSAFSAELLSQFGDLNSEEGKGKPTSRKENQTPNFDAEQETLGQRRRRLQAEREAREREMNYKDLTPGTEPKLNRRLSMADVLAAHPKKDDTPQALEERRRMDEQARLAREQEAKMAAMRRQMPTALHGPSLERSGGFRGGLYNDGLAGGQHLHAMRSNPTLQQTPLQHRASAVFSAYGASAQPPYAGTNPYGGMSHPRGYQSTNTLSQYGVNNNSNNVYGGGMHHGAPYPMPMGGSVDRVEQWRQGVQ